MTNTPKVPKPLLRLDTHYRVIISLVLAAIVCFSVVHTLSVASTILLTWMTFALCAIIMDWVIILTAHPRNFRKVATLEDSSRTMIFIIVIGASLVSLFAIIFLLKTAKGTPHADVTGHILLVISSVIVSWILVHTLFTLRYAHMYYDTDDDDGDAKPLGGLDFPSEKNPDYLDFVYFAFVIGMTFQVSDVEISDRKIRRLAWMHGMISFAFNTAIVALSINVITGLVEG
ncbi:DUF1345 domain-containing protein [Mucilaginibacter polytrichastri]|uniref:DUF1345 domain-containing protein n=1 Tax=Mucilaginibacter polytrichastri TaxID=1302689 RepID=A0A1Q6A118_9SPHI|nr:DUF1345 domain-containing protein [Mucilaginibacter polytrichastri]OKS87706.1 hypothetical protein RG47T_3168 [Mucilaginibacter polytrichastri]SFT20059.1 Uncharacterized membrane protein [Mucilaginibacter polytrichastri]